MSSYQCDNFVPLAIRQKVDGSTPAVSDAINLFGASAISIQVVCKDGAAGTLYVDGTNQTVPNASNQHRSAFMPVWVQVTSQPITANQTALLSYSLNDSITAMHSLRCRFVPSAAGDVVVSVNVRLTSN